MNEEKYKILWDLEQIRKILNKKELQSKRIRIKLVRLLYNAHFFKSMVGRYFLEFLLSERFCVDDINAVLKECVYFEEVLQLSEENVEKMVNYQNNISTMQYSEVGLRIGKCISKYLENEINELYIRKKKAQWRDKEVIDIFNAKFDVSKEKDADKVYEPKKKLPIEDFLREQGRFNHLFKKGNEDLLVQFQQEVDRRWENLLYKCAREN